MSIQASSRIFYLDADPAAAGRNLQKVKDKCHKNAMLIPQGRDSISSLDPETSSIRLEFEYVAHWINF